MYGIVSFAVGQRFREMAIRQAMGARRGQVIRSVVFDVGETLLDDTREWGRWADWLGVPRHTFSAVIGSVVSSGRYGVEAFDYFRPGFGLASERAVREAAGVGERIEEQDLYPDARSGMRALREAGFWVGVAGNQSPAPRCCCVGWTCPRT